MDSRDINIVCAHDLAEEKSQDFLWGYDGFKGLRPETWANQYPKCINPSQSPINIISANAQYDKAIEKKPLKFQIVHNVTNIQKIIRTPHNFVVRVDGTGSISGGPLKQNEIYRLASFGFKFRDSDGSGGSEHSIDGQEYPAELHITFWNTKYQSYTKAIGYSDGLAIVVVMYEVGPRPKHQGIENMIIAYNSLNERRSSGPMGNSVVIQDLLPSNTTHYFTYQGSLTTPPCNQCVTWIIMRHTCTMLRSQLNSLINTHRHRGCCSDGSNCRPLQPLNNRQVFASNCRDPYSELKQ